MAEPIALLTAVAATVVGIGLSYFGYEIAQKVLVLAGTVAGFAAGFFVGGAVYPSVAAGLQSTVLTLVTAIVGAILGRIFVPAMSGLAFGLAGFVMTSLSVLAFLSGGRIVDVILAAVPTSLAGANPMTVLGRIASAPLFRDSNFGQALLIAAAFGVVGGAIALLFYDEFVAVATTAVGASLLGLAIPVLIAAYEDGVASSSAAEFSMLWFAVTFATGLAFELYRNREEMSVI